MIRRPYQDHMRGEPVYLEQKRGDDSLDLPCFMLISALFRDGVKLIEEHDASASPHKLKGAI